MLYFSQQITIINQLEASTGSAKITTGIDSAAGTISGITKDVFTKIPTTGVILGTTTANLSRNRSLSNLGLVIATITISGPEVSTAVKTAVSNHPRTDSTQNQCAQLPSALITSKLNF